MRLTLLGRVPSKKNSKQIVFTKGRPRIISSADYLAWHETQSWALKKFKQKHKNTMEGPLMVRMTFWADNKRQFDLTNKAESVMDLLVDNGILKDDSWAVVDEVVLKFGGVDKDNARVEVEIY